MTEVHPIMEDGGAPSAAAARRTEKLRLPGANCCAYIMLPFRIVFTLLMFLINWPMMTLMAVSRAMFLRCCCGKPSKILKYGAKGSGNGGDKKNRNHWPDNVRFCHCVEGH